MKKIIGGALYNTDTAKLLGSYESSYSQRDYKYYEENLYRTKAGKYFLSGWGGPASKYAVQIDTHNWSGGNKITPLTYDEAREWAEEHLNADEYTEIFGEPEEASENAVKIMMVISAGARTKLERVASRAGKTMSEIIEKLILDMEE